MYPLHLTILKNKKGFTLIEILIAVSLTAILVTALYQTFFSVIKTGDIVEEGLDKYLEAGRFLDKFEQEVNAAYYKTTNPETIFAGEKRRMASEVSFTTFTHPILKEGMPASDLSAVRYFVDEEKDGDIIYKEIWNPFIGKRFKIEALKRVKGFDVSFFNGKDWAFAWDSSLEKKLPEAIKVSISIEEGKELSAIAAPKIK
jgi:general secretion pathway protein J